VLRDRGKGKAGCQISVAASRRKVCATEQWRVAAVPSRRAFDRLAKLRRDLDKTLVDGFEGEPLGSGTEKLDV